jgi:PIN domain nuclease of toxin-antitoxin system
MIVAVADTHALVWALMGDARLSPAARVALTVSATDQIAVSAISLVEIAYLEEKRRLPPGLLARVIASVATPGGIMIEVPVDVSVVKALIRVPRDAIPDMPDRIIAATALDLGVPLISRDAKIRASSITTIW